MATLGSVHDSVGPYGLHFFVDQAADGKYYLAEWGGANRFVFVYNQQGTLERTIGREGGGPGEFKIIAGLTAKGDSLIVWESGGKFSVFDGSGRLVADGLMPFAPRQLVATPSGGWVGWANIRSSALVGFPHHFYDHNLEYLKSVASANVKELPNTQGYLAPLSSGFMLLDSNAQMVEFYTHSGAFLRAVELTAPWLSLAGLEWITYKGPATEGGGMARGPKTPPPSLRAARIDDGGLLWVFGAVEASDWRNRNVDFRGPNATIKLDPGYWDKTWDAMVDIIEPQTGRLIHRQRLPFYVYALIERDLLVRPTQDSDGWLRVEIWRARLTGWK